MPTFPHLRALVAIADTGSFSAAAIRLGVSQSAVSHAIAALERETGRPVLVRGAQLAPTALGHRVLAHARVAAAAVQAVDDLVREPREGTSGSITLAATPTACHSLVPGLMARWSHELAELEVVMLEGEDDEVAAWLEAGVAEVALVIDPESAQADSLLVGLDEFHAVLRRDHPLAGEPEVALADLADDPLLLSRGGCEKQIRELHRRARVPFEPTHRIRQLSTIFALVAAGSGISLVPGSACGMEGPDVVMVRVTESPSRRLVLTGPLRRPWHPAVAAMIDVARAGELGVEARAR